MREKHRSVAVLYALQLGIETSSRVCALTGSRTYDLLVYGMMRQPADPRRPGLTLTILEEMYEASLILTPLG